MTRRTGRAAGGAATARGLLYQALVAAMRATEAEFRAHGGGSPRPALLIIEPRGGGGDHRILVPGERISEQVKGGHLANPWTCAEFFGGAVKDLLVAVEGVDVDGATRARYRCVIEGRAPWWPKAEECFGVLSLDTPQDPSYALGTVNWVLGPGWAGRAPTLLERILAIVDGDLAERTPHERQTLERRVWHVLRRLEVVQVPEADARRQLDTYLYEVVDDDDVVPEKRDALCGRLLDLMAVGDVAISADRLFAHVNLDRRPLSIALEDREAAARHVRPAMKWERFQGAKHIPRFADQGIGSSVLVVGGPSGIGKSWQLCALAEKALKEPATAVLLLRASATADTTWDDAAAHLARQLGRDARRGPDIVANQMARRSRPDARILVCIDDVRTFDLLRALITKAASVPRLSLILAVPPAVADAIDGSGAEGVQVTRLDRFTPREAMLAAKASGIAWTDLDADVQALLQWPLAVRLYAESPPTSGPLVLSEQGLLRAFWDHVGAALARQEFHQVLVDLCEALATALIDNRSGYPLSDSDLKAAGLPPAAHAALVNLGMLRRDASGRYEMTHDRLLSWAVATSMSARLCRSAGDCSERSAILAFLKSHQVNSIRGLSNIASDLVWAMTCQVPPRHADAAVVIATMLDTRYDWKLLGDYLASLGPQILASLELVLASSHSDEASLAVPIVARVLAVLPASDEYVRGQLRGWLNSPDEHLRLTALLALEQAPVPDRDILEALWREYAAAPRSGTALSDDEVRVRRALHVCARLNTDWICESLEQHCDDPRSLSRLAALFQGVPSDAARSCWPRAKAVLPLGLGPGHPEVAGCIHHVGDSGAVPYLRGCLDVDDRYTQQEALEALAYVEPCSALAWIRSSPMADRLAESPFASTALRPLLEHQRTETIAAVLGHVQAGGEHSVAWLLKFKEWPNEMNPLLLDAALASAAAVPAALLNDISAADGHRADDLFELLQNTWYPALLDTMRGHADTDDERALIRLVNELGRSSDPRGVAPAALEVLRKMQGGGFSLSLADLIRDGPEDLRRWCLRWALVVQSPAITASIRSIVGPDLADSDSVAWDRCVDALAAAKEVDDVASAFVSASRLVGGNCGRLLRANGPIGEEWLARLLQELESVDFVRARVSAWLLAWGGTGETAASLRDAAGGRLRDDRSVVEAAVTAQWAHASESEDARVFLEAALHQPGVAAMAGRALVLAFGPAGRQAVGDFLATEDAAGIIGMHGLELARRLHRANVEGAGQLISLWARRSPYEARRQTGWMTDAATGGDGDVLRVAWDAALDPSVDVSRGARSGALRVVAQSEAELAFEQARRLLEQGGRQTAEYANLLVELDPKRAVTCLIEHALRVKEDVVHAGAALSDVPWHIAEAELRALLSSSDQRRRRLGCQIAEWFPRAELASQLRQLSAEDPDKAVRFAAMDAARAFRDHEAMRALWARLEVTSDTREAVALMTEGIRHSTSNEEMLRAEVKAFWDSPRGRREEWKIFADWLHREMRRQT